MEASRVSAEQKVKAFAHLGFQVDHQVLSGLPRYGDKPAADGSGVRALNDQRLARIFAATDLLAIPTTPNPPHGHDGPGEILSVALTWAFNLSGHPAVSLPAGLSAAGTPVGLQPVARHGDEAALWFVSEKPEPMGPTGGAPRRDRAVTVSRS